MNRAPIESDLLEPSARPGILGDRAGPARHRRLPRPGHGLLVALLLLLALESWLHCDRFLLQFRSVFAAGRAMDKLTYAELHRPGLLILGNSRADNAFDPRTVVARFDPSMPRGGFNLGLPGADMQVISGVVERLDRAGDLGPDGVRMVVLSLDESVVQKVDTLGQEVFLVRPGQFWADGQLHEALRSSFRLYGYADNFRQLREPAVLQRFVRALREDVDPVGGAAAGHFGYRAGFGGLQDEDAAKQQEAGSTRPPSDANLRALWRLLELLTARGVQVVVVYPPLLNRDLLYLTPERPEAAPFLSIVQELKRRGVPTIALDAGPTRDAREFVNAGHLNDRGAQRYSALLGQALRRVTGIDTGSDPAHAP